MTVQRTDKQDAQSLGPPYWMDEAPQFDSDWSGLCYIYNKGFDTEGVEDQLFGPGAEQIAPLVWTNYAKFDEEAPLTVQQPKVLKTAEERHLFLRYNYARYRLCKLLEKRKRRGSGAVARQQEIELWQQRVARSRSDLAQANMALVLAMAKRVQIPHVEFEDLVSEGNMALLRCIDKFDVSRGFKFSTYACRGILKSFHRLSTKSARYRQQFPTSFEADLGPPGVEDNKHDVEWDDSIHSLRQLFANNRAQLSQVEQQVVMERFALTSRGKGLTLLEIGKIVGVSTERVRQILNQALAKIRLALDGDLVAA